MAFKLSNITSEKGEKIVAGMKINISRISIAVVPAYGKAVSLYQGEKVYSSFGKALVAKAEAILNAVPHDVNGRLEEIIPVEIYERVSKDRRTYLDMRDED